MMARQNAGSRKRRRGGKPPRGGADAPSSAASDNLMDDLLSDFDDDAEREDGGDLVDDTIDAGGDVEDVVVNVDDVPADVAAAYDQAIRERDDAVEARQRALADYANFQRRALENERRALSKGTTDLVRLLIPVLDQFDLALNQDMEQVTTEQFASGVALVQEGLFKALREAGVEIIKPEVGEPLDPNRHAAMMRMASEDVEENCVVQVLQPGYAKGELVIRAAQVVVAGE